MSGYLKHKKSQKIGSSACSSASTAESETLEKSLECPICFEFIDTVPIRLCSTGHMFCGSCRSKMAQCPLCQAPFTNTRNFLAESLLQKILKFCKNKNAGCNFKAHGSYRNEDITAHAHICDFRPFVCNLPGPHHNCNGTKIRYDNMTFHITTAHGLQGYESSEASFAWGSSKESLEEIFNGLGKRTQCVYLKCYDMVFLACQMIFCSKVFLCAILVGNEIDANGFHVKIAIENVERGIKSTWQGPVHSIRRPTEDLLSEGKGLYLPSEAFYTFTENSNFNPEELSWTLSYEIEKLTSLQQRRFNIPLNPEPQMAQLRLA